VQAGRQEKKGIMMKAEQYAAQGVAAEFPMKGRMEDGDGRCRWREGLICRCETEEEYGERGMLMSRPGFTDNKKNFSRKAAKSAKFSDYPDSFYFISAAL